MSNDYMERAMPIEPPEDKWEHPSKLSRIDPKRNQKITVMCEAVWGYDPMGVPTVMDYKVIGWKL